MSSSIDVYDLTAARPAAGAHDGPPPLPPLLRCAIALALAAVATGLGFILREIAGPANVILLFVLAVVVSAIRLGWGASLTAAIAGVLAFDVFFTAPFYSLRIDSPTDWWSAGLLLVIAAIVSTVAEGRRRQAGAAVRAAAQSRALQGLAHVVIEHRSDREVLDAAAQALQAIFQAPAAIYVETAGQLSLVAQAGAPTLTAADEDAAKTALQSRLYARAGVYPFDGATFDFWPLAAGPQGRFVLGAALATPKADRPEAPERFFEVVGAYVASALGGSRRP